jgi:hypothetical protein
MVSGTQKFDEVFPHYKIENTALTLPGHLLRCDNLLDTPPRI